MVQVVADHDAAGPVLLAPVAAAIAAATGGAATPAVHSTVPASWRVTVPS